MVMILSSLLCDWNGSPHIAELILDNSGSHVSNFLLGVEENVTYSFHESTIGKHAIPRQGDEPTAGALARRVGQSTANLGNGFRQT
jgi:hypothetical protein